MKTLTGTHTAPDEVSRVQIGCRVQRDEHSHSNRHSVCSPGGPARVESMGTTDRQVPVNSHGHY